VIDWMDQWEDVPIPVAHSLEETAELAFQAQDRQDTRDAKEARRQRNESTRLADEVDVAETLAWLGRPMPGALERFRAASDRLDAVEEYQRKHHHALKARAQEERIAELEAQLEAASMRAAQLGRNFSQAVEGWGRARAEAAGFRDAAYRSYYR
jgi:predicted RNase H-like nuclease (RuvC/YqgF family)